jgi:hypothetical protein
MFPARYLLWLLAPLALVLGSRFLNWLNRRRKR